MNADGGRGPSAPAAAAHPWAIVARREFVERGRDRGFVISTAITLLVLAFNVMGDRLRDVLDPRLRGLGHL